MKTEKFRKKRKEKIVLSDAIIFRLLKGTPCAGEKINRTADLLAASYAARPSRDHLATDPGKASFPPSLPQ